MPFHFGVLPPFGLWYLFIRKLTCVVRQFMVRRPTPETPNFLVAVLFLIVVRCASCLIEAGSFGTVGCWLCSWLGYFVTRQYDRGILHLRFVLIRSTRVLAFHVLDQCLVALICSG